MTIAQGFYRRAVPQSLRLLIDRSAQARALARLNQTTCVAAALRQRPPDLTSVAAQEWDSVRAATSQFAMDDLPGAVNHGDRRAIYQLTRAMGARSILEIGTHLGASTVMLALALQRNGGGPFVSADIKDVNGPGGAWAEFRRKCTPRDMTKSLGVDVRYTVGPSVWYLANTDERFDLIFLDGGHEAATVYTEIPLALKRLNPGGMILLHDVYPDERPLWDDGFAVPGPWMALQRFAAEGAPIRAVPLGALPWPTKAGSNITSLAYLVSA